MPGLLAFAGARAYCGNAAEPAEVSPMRAPRFIHQHRFDLAADAILLASGLYAAVTSLGLTVWWVTGSLPTTNTDLGTRSSTGAVGVVISVFSSLMIIAGAVVGPALAWRLHGHALRWRHAVGLFATPLLIAVLGIVLPLLSGILGLLAKPFTSNEYAGPIGTAIVFSVLYVALLVHAARDAMAPAGDPPLLERLRLLSLTALVVLALVVAGALALGYASQIGEALIFAELFGFTAATAVLIAALVDRLVLRQPRA